MRQINGLFSDDQHDVGINGVLMVRTTLVLMALIVVVVHVVRHSGVLLTTLAAGHVTLIAASDESAMNLRTFSTNSSIEQLLTLQRDEDACWSLLALAYARTVLGGSSPLKGMKKGLLLGALAVCVLFALFGGALVGEDLEG